MNEINKVWHAHSGKVLDSINNFDVIDCELCGFKHIVPIPTVAELESIYRHQYYTTEKPLYLERYQADLAWWNLVYQHRYEQLEALLPGARRRLVDIGSGPGYFLKMGEQRHWQVLGLEPSAKAAAHARGMGLTIVEEFLDQSLANTLGRFDVVHLSDVLEHVPDPKALLAATRDLLTPAGLVCIVVPNDYNPFQGVLRADCGYDPWWVAPPHHINYFNFSSLERLLEANGFRVEAKEATFPIDMFLLMGQNYVGNDELGRKCHTMRMQFEMNLATQPGLLRSLYAQFANLGIGREIVMFARLTEQG